MKKVPPKLTISERSHVAVPKGDTNKLRDAVRERVIKPMQDRAKEQRQLIAKVRARPVR